MPTITEEQREAIVAANAPGVAEGEPGQLRALIDALIDGDESTIDRILPHDTPARGLVLTALALDIGRARRGEEIPS